MIFLPQPSSLSYGEGTFTIHYDSRIFLDSESPAEPSLAHRKTSRSADLWKAAFSTACRHSVR